MLCHVLVEVEPLMQVLTEAVGAKVLFADSKYDGDLVASGVEFIHRGTTYRAYASKEVVLTAG